MEQREGESPRSPRPKRSAGPPQRYGESASDERLREAGVEGRAALRRGRRRGPRGQDADGALLWEARAIDFAVRDGQEQVLVTYVGYDNNEDQWLPLTAVTEAVRRARGVRNRCLDLRMTLQC